MPRKKTYTDNDLLRKVAEFQQIHPNESITIQKLQAWSGISRDQWYRHKAVKSKIDEINNAPILIKITPGMELPSADEILNNCRNSDLALTKTIQELLDIIAKLSLQADKSNIKKLRDENERLRNSIAEKDALIEHLKNEFDISHIENISHMSNEDLRKGMERSSFKTQFTSLFD